MSGHDLAFASNGAQCIRFGQGAPWRAVPCTTAAYLSQVTLPEVVMLGGVTSGIENGIANPAGCLL